MPSQKRRIALTVDDDLHSLLEELSELTKQPKTKIIIDILNDVKPVLTEMRDALEMVEQKKSAIPNLARLAATINSGAGVVNAEMADLLNQYELLGDEK
jgi:predicted transcriptional regulator